MKMRKCVLYLNSFRQVGQMDLSPLEIDCFQFELIYVLQEGGPLSGLEKGLLSNTQKRIVQGDTCAGKVRDVIGKGHPVEGRRVREPRRTAL